MIRRQILGVSAAVLRHPGRVLLAFGVLTLGWVAVRGLPGSRPSNRPGSCTLSISVAVPALEALPVTTLGAVPTRPGRVCPVVIQGPGAMVRDALAVVPGTFLLRPGTLSGRIAFLLVAERSDAVLLGRSPVGPHFLWHDLAGKVVLLPARAGDLGPLIVQAMTRHHALENPLLLSGLGEKAYLSGNGSYLETSLSAGLRLASQGRGQIAAFLGIQAGPIPAAVLTATPRLAQEHPRLLDEIARAVFENALRLTNHPPGSGAPDAVQAKSRREASRMRLWATDPRLDASLFVRLGALMAAAGTTASPPPPGTILPGPAEFALRKALPTSTDVASTRHE